MAHVHGFNAAVLADKYDLTADGTEFTVSVDHPTADITGFGSAAKSVVKGSYSWKGDYKGWHNNRGGTAGADVAMFRLMGSAEIPGSARLWGFFPEGFGTGKVGYCGPAVMNGQARTTPIGGAVGASCGVVGTANLGRAVVFNGGTALSANGTSGVVDNAAASTVGGCGYMWIPGEVAGTIGTILIQHSADDITYADLCTFGTVNAAGGGTAQWAPLAKATTVNRYTRAVWGLGTSASFNGTVVLAFARY